MEMICEHCFVLLRNRNSVGLSFILLLFIISPCSSLTVFLLCHRGNQYVKLKLKIPTKLTPRQTELIQEFEGTASTTASTGTGSGSASAADCRQTFNIQEAWKRLKDYLGKDSAEKESKEKAKEEAKAKAAI